MKFSNDNRALHLVMVTTAGTVRNSYYSIVQREVTMDDLFAV